MCSRRRGPGGGGGINGREVVAAVLPPVKTPPQCTRAASRQIVDSMDLLCHYSCQYRELSLYSGLGFPRPDTLGLKPDSALRPGLGTPCNTWLGPTAWERSRFTSRFSRLGQLRRLRDRRRGQFGCRLWREQSRARDLGPRRYQGGTERRAQVHGSCPQEDRGALPVHSKIISWG